MKVRLKRKEKVKKKKRKSGKLKSKSEFGGELIEFIFEVIIELIFG
ncbi:MAG: hypothetical protein K2K14_05950 [Ruminococcus sp.]|nr:hypothetical protein [Ruminococcus sp.]